MRPFGIAIALLFIAASLAAPPPTDAQVQAPWNGTPLLLPPSLSVWIDGEQDEETLEGRLDRGVEATVVAPERLASWTETAILQLRLGQPRRALRTLTRARAARAWPRPEAAQLAFLEAAARVALESSESDPLEGEKHLQRASELLHSIEDVEGMGTSCRWGLAWIECEWGRTAAAQALLDSLPSLPVPARRRLWKAMVRASSSGMDTWSPHFEAARAAQDTWRMREAARLAPASYLLTLQKSMDGPIEEGLERSGNGREVDFHEVESLMEAIPWDPPDFYAGVRRRMQAIRSLQGSSAKQALQLVRDQHRFDALFSQSQWSWKERCRRAVALSEGKGAACSELGLWYLAGRWHWGRGFALGELGKVREQREEYRQAVRCAEELGDPAYLFSCWYNLFMIYGVSGDRAQRLRILPRLGDLAERYGISTLQFELVRAGALEDLGDLDRSWKAVVHAYRESRRRGDRYLQIVSLNGMAWIALARGHMETAERCARTELQRVDEDFLDDLPASYRQSIQSKQTWALLARGRALPSGDPRRMSWYDKALESTRGPGQYRQTLYVQLARAEEQLQTGRIGAARQTLQESEALARREQLAYDLWRVDALQARRLLREGSPREAAARYENALHRLETLSAELDEAQMRAELLLPASDLFDEYIELLAGVLHDPAAAYAVDERARARALLERVGEDSPLLVGSPDSSSLSVVERVQATLAPGELLVQYRVNQERIDVWTLGSSRLRYAAVAIGRAELSRRIADWERSIHSGVPSPLAHELADLLLAPIEDERRQARRVIIVADAPLSRLPFVLLRPHGEPLLREQVVSYELSGSIRVLLSARPPLDRRARLLAVGYGGSAAPSHLGIRPLPLAEEEARQVAALSADGVALCGERATASAVSAALAGGVGILHIASHSGLDEFGEPFLLLAPEDSRAGLLHGGELTRWPLRKVSLVTLAGCESSQLGSSVVEGGLSTLGAAIFSGGSRDLIASLWKVEDEATLELMRTFYRRLLGSNDSVAAALQGAQLEMAQGDGRLERDWGAFRAYGP